jgi:hypothetical protein
MGSIDAYCIYARGNRRESPLSMLDFLGNNEPTPGPMLRKPRGFLPGIPAHVLQRGNNR